MTRLRILDLLPGLRASASAPARLMLPLLRFPARTSSCQGPNTTLIRGVVAQRTTLEATTSRPRSRTAGVVVSRGRARRGRSSTRGACNPRSGSCSNEPWKGRSAISSTSIDADSLPARDAGRARRGRAPGRGAADPEGGWSRPSPPGTIDESAPSLFQAMERDRGERGADHRAGSRSSRARSISIPSCQPGDRFGLAFERFVREDERTATYGSITAAGVRQRGPPRACRALHAAWRKGGLFRRAGALAAPLLPAVAVEVRAARHLAVFAAASSIPCCRPRARTAASTTGRPPGAPVGGGGRRDGRVGEPMTT